MKHLILRPQTTRLASRHAAVGALLALGDIDLSVRHAAVVFERKFNHSIEL